MRRATRAILLAISASAVMASAVYADAGGNAAVPLNTGQEADKVVGGASGDLDWSVDGTTFCYTLTVKGLTTPAVAAHIHIAPRGVAGPVVIPLSVPSATAFTTSGCVESSTAPAVAANPGDYYVNVHTSTYPAGEVRGQLK